jgi:UDP-N-acetylmuramate--alanine ligase
VDSRVLYRGIRNHGHRAVRYCDSIEDTISELLDQVRPGDIVLTLGAGDIHLVGTDLLKRIEN